MLQIVFTALCEGRLKDLKDVLDPLPQWEVSEVLLEKGAIDALMVSCWNGHQEVVEYLVNKCPDFVMMTGSVYLEWEVIKGVSPLWFTAVAGHLDIVKMLVKSGANVNFKTSTNSTPLRAACFYGHYEIVKYLVENNADMDVDNIAAADQTCLMLACKKGHLKIAKYLIEMGADVNRVLNYCAEEGHLDIIKLLLILEARIHVDNNGMTPLLVASVRGHLHIVEHIITQEELVTKQERIDALELLGATFVDKKQDLIGAATLWKWAMEERYEVPVIPKTTRKSPCVAYNNQLEVETVIEMEQMSTEPDSMWMQALLVRERILGIEHPETCRYIRERGKVYAVKGNYNRCISLWMYALDIQQKYLKPLDSITQQLLGDFTILFYKMTDGELQEHFCDIMMVLTRAVKEVQAGRGGALAGRINRAIFRVLLLVCRLTKLIPYLEKEQVFEVKKAVHFFVIVGVKGYLGASPLHLACSKSPATIRVFHLNHFPSIPTINLLLECGAPVDDMDNDGNTALHTAALIKPVEVGVIKSLLQNGAHFDFVNNQKKTFYDLLQEGSLLIVDQIKVQHEITKLPEHLSLKCLAARMVRKHDLKLDSLPLTLKDFVLKH